MTVTWRWSCPSIAGTSSRCSTPKVSWPATMAGAVLEPSATCCTSPGPRLQGAIISLSASERAPPTASTPTGWPLRSPQLDFAASIEPISQSGLGRPYIPTRFTLSFDTMLTSTGVGAIARSICPAATARAAATPVSKSRTSTSAPCFLNRPCSAATCGSTLAKIGGMPGTPNTTFGPSAQANAPPIAQPSTRAASHRVLIRRLPSPRSPRLLVAPIPGKVTAGHPIDQRLEADSAAREHEHGDDRLIVAKAAGVEENEEAEPVHGDEELRHHRADERASRREPDSRQQIRHRRRQHDVDEDAQAARAEASADLEVLERHGARAVGGVEHDREERREDGGREPRTVRVAEPQRDQRQDRHHGHGEEPEHVVAEQPVHDEGAAHGDAHGDAEGLDHGAKSGRRRREKGAAAEHGRKHRDNAGGTRHIGGGPGTDTGLPDTQQEGAGAELRCRRRSQESGAPAWRKRQRPALRGHFARFRQAAQRRSIAPPSSMRATPSKVTSRIAAKIVAISKLWAADCSIMPSPLALRKNSAAIMPTSARPIAWRMPVSANGSTKGSSTSRQSARSVERNDRATSMSSNRMLRAPSTVL